MLSHRPLHSPQAAGRSESAPLSRFSTSPNPTQEGNHHLKLTTKRDELVAKLSVVSRAVSTRAATQSLSGILLTAEDGGVSLSATDLEMGLKTKLDAEVDGGGTVLLPGRLLAELARSLGDPTVEIELREAERDVEIRSGGSSFHLRTLPSEDFPELPRGGGRAADDPGRGARRDRRAGRPRRLARRHAPGADRRPGQRQRLGDDDGRDRLLPARGQADRAGERDRRRAGGEHPGQARCASSAGSSRPTASRRSPSPCSATRPSSRQGRSSSTRG